MALNEKTRCHAAIGAGVALVAAALFWGAMSISSQAGYSVVGPNFIPLCVSLALGLCGVWLVWEARTGGFRSLAEPSGAPRGDWRAVAWVGAGVLANAALVTRLGFVLSCALCFVLAVRGLRLSEGRPAGGPVATAKDALTGLLISAPVYWMFSKGLNISLPGLTGTGWI